MFGPPDAEAYFSVSLLKREPRPIQWHTDVNYVTGVFLAAPPPGLACDRDDWVIDYAVRSTGPVIQQKIWTPRSDRTPSDRVRRVDHEPLPPPIFFIHNNGWDLGLPLVEAAGGNCMSLRGAEEEAPVGPSAHAQIRINWCGYQYLDWNEQISMRRHTGTREKKIISLETFAKHVGRKVLKFMETAKCETYDGDQRYLIGDQRITPRDITLIGTVRVSQGSFMPILQLNNEEWYTRCM
ncbi:hypothetical protein BJV77DRAFT_790154 [Russula vinacea]|nr:hypothetical protein BJV77DRAFT_790154 [Russula vinacea]